MKIHHSRGFSLIELLVTVAIVGILASVAYPSYREYILKGKRAQARTALLELMQQQERYFTQLNSYISFNAGSATGLNAANASVTVPFKTYAGDASASTNAPYLLGARTCGGSLTLQDCIQVFATPVASDPLAGTLTFTSTGIKSCTGSDPSVCW